MIAHLPALPIVLPLVAAGLALLVERRGIALQRAIGLGSASLLLVLAGWLAVRADSGEVSVYLLGNWQARIGIALAVDRLAAIMLVTTAVLGLAALLYAASGWDRRAPHFHALFQIQLMGLNGAFLTADLFNLFVFFEVLLIASYGLMLSGGRGARMRAGMHYVTFNIAASTLYLFAVGLLYGLLGALNMAELAQRVASAPAADLPLIQAAAGLLLVVFCAKAALFPLYLWLPQTYAHTPAPVVALFAVMTKLGVYAVLRVYTLMFGAEAGPLAGVYWPWLLAGGAAGLVLASFGALAARSLRQLAAYLVVASAGTLFVAVALATPAAIGAGLYYLVQSSFAAAALFLLADTVHRQRQSAGDTLRTVDRIGSRALIGGLFFVAAVSIVGLPPLAGFVGKFSLLAAVPEPHVGWLWTLILVTSLMALVALTEAGIFVFWREDVGDPPTARPPHAVEVSALGGLLALALLLSLCAAPALRYGQAAAEQLAAPAAYRAALLSAPVVPAPAERPR